ncbi:heterokaryon incompatibility protein-domain-containing protein, partial [Dendryphion nanum]
YEAFSYVWGDRMHKSQIQLRGNPFAVSENLYLSLQNLRSTEKDRILWIDALCINQSNQRERENQLPLMGSIYKEAGNVVVWLGESWENCDLAIEYVTQLGENENLHINPATSPSAEVRGYSMESVEIQGALKDFINRPWWSRVWTVQEFVLANKSVFQCGQHQIDDERIRESVRHFYRHQQACCFKLGDPAQISLFDSLLVMESL